MSLRIIATLALLGATLLRGGASAADAQAVKYYEDAVSRLNAGDAKGALIQLRNALQRDPAQLSAKILIGRTYLALGQPRLAEEEILNAQKLGADPLLIALDLARARNEQGKFGLNVQGIVPTRFPKAQQPDLWVELGIARLGEDDSDGARGAFEEALRIRPGHTGAKVGLARIPLQEGRYAEAERLAREALKADPEHVQAWFVTGSAAHAQGRFEDAAMAYAKAHQRDPRHLPAALGEATAMLEAGKPARAAALLEPLRKQHPGLATIPYLQSEAFRAMGMPDEASLARAAAVDIIGRYAPADVAHPPSNLLLFGTIAFESGQLETAHGFLSAYAEANGGDVQGRKMLARTLLALGKPGQAKKLLSRLSAIGHADAESLALLGDAYIQLGDHAAAERYYRSALTEHNGGPAIVRRLGMTQFHSGQRDQALSTLRTLVDQTEGAAGADAALLLGMLYYGENRLIEAAGIADRLAGDDPKNFTARNLQGLIAVARGNIGQGRKILEAIVSEAPDFRPARYNLIKLDAAQGRSAAADAALRELLASNPNDVRALLESARFALGQGDPHIGIQHLERIRELEPKNTLANVELINAYLANRQVTQARARATALDRVVPNDFLVKEAVARVQIAAGDRIDATLTLQVVARLAGEDPERLTHTARLQSLIGAFNDAAWSLTKALAAHPDNIQARVDLAKALFRQRKFEQAEVEVNNALERNPRGVRGIALLGDIRMAQGRTAEAIDLYHRGREVADTPRLVVSLHRALMTAGRETEALDTIKAWHAQHPGIPLVMDLLADHLQHAGDHAMALELREKLVDLNPGDAVAWRKLAAALASSDTERALKAAKKAYELAPHNAAVLDTLGWALVQLGSLDEGLAHLREALSRNSGSATTRYHLAVALQEYGNINGARRELEQALRLSDGFPERDEAIARLNALAAER